MMDLVIKRLSQWGAVTAEDRLLIGSLSSYKARRFPARHLIAVPAGRSTVSFLLRGWICQYGQLHDGRRQILSLTLPGDFVTCRQLTPHDAEPSLHTLTEAVLLDVPLEKVESLCIASPRLAAMFRQAENVQAATSREWVISLGVRKAKERCAHLICEIVWRLRAVALASEGWFEFPLTQDELGYAIGTTTVTVNKVLQDLRHAKLIEQHGRKMRVADLAALESFALFDPAFLLLRSRPPSGDRLPKPSSRSVAADALRP